MSRRFLGRFCLQFLALACVLLVTAQSHGQGDITNFTGGDPGEGLDLDGEFVYAVNTGDDLNTYVVNGVEFTPDMDTDGFELFSTHNDATWATPQYTAFTDNTENDKQLEEIMSTIMWSASPNAVEIDMDVEPGETYQLQMLFNEACCNRGFDIFLEDDLLVEDFAIHEHHLEWDGVGNWGIPNRDNGVVIKYGFVAGDSTLNLELGGDTTAPAYPDNNGHISGFILEKGGGGPVDMEIGNFTGGDPGEGLDLEGDVIYAINIGDDDPPSPYTVQGVEFTHDQFTDGIDVITTNEIRDGSWSQPEFDRTAQDSENDEQLEGVMRSIRWSQSPSAVEIDMDVETGQSYKLQMLFTESCCNRGFDVIVEDELLSEDFAIHENHLDWDGVGNWNISNRDNGVLITHEFVAEDDSLNIEVGGDATAPDYPDNNGHISALTLEVGASNALQAGDADEDCDFDQIDLVKVQIAGKYLTGEAATWGDGDWDGAPGGEPGSPPPGDGVFDQLDIIAALNAGLYLQPPYCDPGGFAALSAVPEPSTVILLALGLATAAVLRPRRRS